MHPTKIRAKHPFPSTSCYASADDNALQKDIIRLYSRSCNTKQRPSVNTLLLLYEPNAMDNTYSASHSCRCAGASMMKHNVSDGHEIPCSCNSQCFVKCVQCFIFLSNKTLCQIPVTRPWRILPFWRHPTVIPMQIIEPHLKALTVQPAPGPLCPS